MKKSNCDQIKKNQIVTKLTSNNDRDQIVKKTETKKIVTKPKL